MLLIGIVTFPHVLLITNVTAQDAVRCWFIYLLSGLILVYLLLLDSTHSLKVQHSSAFRHQTRFLFIFFLCCCLHHLKAERSTKTEGAVLHFLPLPAGAGLGTCNQKTLTGYFQIQRSVLTIYETRSHPCSSFFFFLLFFKRKR